MCKCTLFDVGGVEIDSLAYKRSKQCRRYHRYSTDFNALNAVYVKDVKDGVCGFMQHCIQSIVTHFVIHVKGVEGVKYYVLYSVYRASRPSKGEGYLLFEKPSILWV